MHFSKILCIFVLFQLSCARPAAIGGDAGDDADRSADGDGDADADGDELTPEADADADGGRDADLDVEGDADLETDAAADADDEADAEVGCLMPEEACSDGYQTGETCDDSIVIGRASGIVTIDSRLTATSDDNEPSCAGTNDVDRFYRVYLMEGETLSVVLFHVAFCFDGILSVFRTNEPCAERGCGVEIGCQNAYHEAGWNESVLVVAEHEGWYTIAVDSMIPPLPSGADFMLTVEVSCGGDCGCP